MCASEYQSFSWKEAKNVLSSIAENHSFTFDGEKKKFTATNEKELINYSIIPPLLQPVEKNQTLVSYIETLTKLKKFHFSVILIQSGAASLGVWENEVCLEHKVITAYMVRKKQGKSQLTYLHKKGKSRMGSRIRLQNTINFFENINEKLQQWEDYISESDTLFYSCTPRVWGEVFRSKILPPIKKDDPRWRKIPLDVNVPNNKEIMQVARKITRGMLVIEHNKSDQEQNNEN